jgi:arabinofuranosyltransferase
MFLLLKQAYFAATGTAARVTLIFAAAILTAALLISGLKKGRLPMIYGLMLATCLFAASALDSGVTGGTLQAFYNTAYLLFFGYIAVFACRNKKRIFRDDFNAADGKIISFLAAVLCVFIAAALLRTAWICDDAYITARTADNFLHGHGLRWNVDERVQAYTHPLWMFIFIPVYYFLRDPFYSFIVMSFITTVMVIFLIGASVKSRVRFAFILFIIAASKTFIDYSTSGLENPLSHLLLVIFFIFYIKEENTFGRLLALSFVTSLALLNRLDCLLIYIFPLGLAVFEYKKPSAIAALAAGLVPIICWEMFSLLYYGFPFPNTYYAKMARGFSAVKFGLSGLSYILDSVNYDFLTAAVILAGVILPVLKKAGNGTDNKLVMLSAGITAYFFYMIYIGGDFMQGRFFSLPFIAAALILSRQDDIFSRPAFITAVLASAMLCMAPASYSFIRDSLEGAGESITPAREFYYENSSLSRILREGNTQMSYNTLVVQAVGWREQAVSGNKVYSIHSVGFPGFFAGPGVYIVDRLAIPNAFLARLKGYFWEKIGHIYRELPDGYMDTVKSGRNVIKDPGLAEYYDKVRLITSGSLSDKERMKTIIRMNLGRYDYLIKKY